jgi:hypothetical protein
MRNMLVTGGKSNQTDSMGSQQLGIPPGRLVVPPVYIQTSGDLAIQCTANNLVCTTRSTGPIH